MIERAVGVATVAVAALLTIAPAARAQECANADAQTSATEPAVIRDAIACLVNAERAAQSLPAYARNAQLDAAAQEHTDDMARNDYFSHQSQDGRRVGQRIAATGYRASATGENLAFGANTPRAAVRMWMESTPHRANILSAEFTELGVGASREELYTLVFARPAGGSGGGPQTGSGSGTSTGSPGPSSVRVVARRVSVQRGRLVISGRLDHGQTGRRVEGTVRRGRGRAASAVRTTSGGRFVLRVPIPRGRGSLRVTLRVPAVGTVFRPATYRFTVRR